MPRINSIFRNFINGIKGGDSFMLRGRDNCSQQTLQDLQGAIAKKAYELYEKRNYQHGNDMEDWLKAERIVKRSMRFR
jgi:hypothetical protein